MADIAIDPTDIRGPSTSGAAAKPRFRRKTLLIAGGATLGLAVLGGAAATIISNLKLPSSLSGLAFLPKPEAPRRSEIRIGRLPDMPEIRDGVPALVGTKPVRIVETQPPSAPSNLGPRPVAASVVPASSVSAAPLPTTFTGVNAPQLITTVSAPIASSARIEAASGPLLGAAPVPPSTAAPTPRAEPKPATPVQLVKPEPAPAAEPASTASVSAAVPLPPPAPVRSIVARAPDAKPEKPTTRPAQVAARQPAQPVTPGPSEAAAPPADDRLEILGVKVPNGSDLKNAVSSIGEALNLPKVF